MVHKIEIGKYYCLTASEVVLDGPDGPTSTEKLVKCVVVHCTVFLSMSCAETPSVDHPSLKDVKT